MIATVREAVPADSALLHELAAATFALACPPHTTQSSIEDFIGRNLSVEAFDRYLSDPARTVLLIEMGGASVGYSMLVTGEPEDADTADAVTRRPTIELSKCYVLPQHHGAGVAGALMAATVQVARHRGAAGIWLGVNQLNLRANRFYAKQGFVEAGTRRFRVGERWEEDFVRERVLAAE